MRLVVCALSDLEGTLARTRPGGLVSLLAPGQALPAALPAAPAEAARLVLRCHDLAAPRSDLSAPDAAMVEALLRFADGFADEETLVLHCWFGISRSPAAAFILACALEAETPETRLAAALRAASPTATPNPLLIALADARLGRGGRMSAAIRALGRGAEAASGRPFDLVARRTPK
jgi:predicted protein tyrosine phosphatase